MIHTCWILEWTEFVQPGSGHDVLEVRIGDDFHAVASGRQRDAQPNHRMNVAVAAQGRDDELHDAVCES